MVKTKRGGLGEGVLWQTTGRAPSAEKKTNGNGGNKKQQKATPRTPKEKNVKLTVHIPPSQLAGLEKLKARERAQGKRRNAATVTALVIEAIDLLLKKRGA